MTKHKEHEQKQGEPQPQQDSEPHEKHGQKSHNHKEPHPAAQAEGQKPKEASSPDEAGKAAAEIEALKKALAESEDKRIRIVAEMDNLRKRLAKDMEAQRFNIQADTLSSFIQVFDHFSMAVSAAKSSDNLKALLDGMKMIEAEFARAFQETGVEFVSAEGKDFDPNLHEALSQEPSDSVPSGKVLRQWSSACKLGSRLLRPARVVVSSGPAAAEGQKQEEPKA